MIIKKFLHSCILIEEKGKKLLFDPGTFSFIEKKLKPEDIGAVDVIVLTHLHPDHYYPEALKIITALKPTKIVTHEEIGKLLKEEGLSFEAIKAGETKEIEGFTIQAFEAPHGCLPIEVPHNLAYLINNKVLHPGDSYDIHGFKSCELLLLPIAGPWATVTNAFDLAKKIKPKVVIPIHDGIIKEFFLEVLYGRLLGNTLKQHGIEFRALKIEEKLEI